MFWFMLWTTVAFAIGGPLGMLVYWTLIALWVACEQSLGQPS